MYIFKIQNIIEKEVKIRYCYFKLSEDGLDVEGKALRLQVLIPTFGLKLTWFDMSYICSHKNAVGMQSNICLVIYLFLFYLFILSFLLFLGLVLIFTKEQVRNSCFGNNYFLVFPLKKFERRFITWTELNSTKLTKVD